MEILDTCPSCGEEELRPIKIGNNKDGWSLTGDFECDSCGETFVPQNNTDELAVVGDEADILYDQMKEGGFDNHDCHASEEDGCKGCDDYRNYRDSEVLALNSKQSEETLLEAINGSVRALNTKDEYIPV